MTSERDDLIERLWIVHDPEGKQQRDFAQFRMLASNPRAIAKIKQAGKSAEYAKLLQLADQMDGMQAAAADAILRLVPLGWAPSASMPIDDCRAAVEAMDRDDVPQAEEILTDAWSKPPVLKRPALQLYSLEDDEARRELLAKRAELILLAAEDHEAERYHASIPVLLAQIEGLVIDVSGGSRFFSENVNLKADVRGTDSIATLPESLDAVRKVYSENIVVTSAAGSLSRHAILHGRELGYSSRVNSAKTFALLQAVVEWAQHELRGPNGSARGGDSKSTVP